MLPLGLLSLASVCQGESPADSIATRELPIEMVVVSAGGEPVANAKIYVSWEGTRMREE